MEYHPRHPQPFSLSDALKFDLATITEGSILIYYQTVATNHQPNITGSPIATESKNNDHNRLYPIIIVEIARLENSLQHLRRTQEELRSYSDRDDPELSQALRENEAVMFVPPPPTFLFNNRSDGCA